MKNIFERVAKWNSQRYDRVYDHALTIRLLREEYEEYKAATTDVDKLDALCDLVCVAFGAIWKSGLEYDCEDLYLAHDYACSVVAHIPETVYFIGCLLDAEKVENTGDCIWLFLVVMCASEHIANLGVPHDNIYEAISIVCDSNDSKSITKTDPAVKANDGDKGPFYVAPEPKLAEFLKRVQR